MATMVEAGQWSPIGSIVSGFVLAAKAASRIRARQRRDLALRMAEWSAHFARLTDWGLEERSVASRLVPIVAAAAVVGGVALALTPRRRPR